MKSPAVSLARLRSGISRSALRLAYHGPLAQPRTRKSNCKPRGRPNHVFGATITPSES